MRHYSDFLREENQPRPVCTPLTCCSSTRSLSCAHTGATGCVSSSASRAVGNFCFLSIRIELDAFGLLSGCCAARHCREFRCIFCNCCVQRFCCFVENSKAEPSSLRMLGLCAVSGLCGSLETGRKEFLGRRDRTVPDIPAQVK